MSLAELPLANAETTTFDNAPSGIVYFSVSGDGITFDTTLGVILVHIDKQDSGT